MRQTHARQSNYNSERMTTEQNMTLIAVETAKAAIMVIREAETPLSSLGTIQPTLRKVIPTLKQSTVCSVLGRTMA